MRLRHLVVPTIAISGVVLAAAPTTAFAAGPVSPSRGIQTFDCAGLGNVTIVTPPAAVGDSWSAAQIVGGGHFVPVAFRYVATDATAGIVLGDDTVTHGSAHRQQTATTCTSRRQAQVSDLVAPGAPLPDGVAPYDQVTLSFIVTAILQP